MLEITYSSNLCLSSVIYPQPEHYGKYTNIVHPIPITTPRIK